MNRRQLVLLGLAILVSASMAFFLQDLIRLILIEPLFYLWYLINLAYLSVAQAVFWLVLMVIVIVIAFRSLYGKLGTPEPGKGDPVHEHGPIADLARHITNSEAGVYYKWRVANRLGKLARSMLMQRRGRDQLAKGELDEFEWKPPDEVKEYLHSGLTKTFADFPKQKWSHHQRETPFDIDLEQVVSYLESEMEGSHD
jgi:hypothetical protein